MCLVLFGFDRLQMHTLVARRSASAILILAVGFVGAGIGPMLPRWATVIGTNLLLLSAGAFFYSAFTPIFRRGKAEIDSVGWPLVILTALPFWYWGLIEPNGQYRSAIFSLVAAIINARTTWGLLRSQKDEGVFFPIWFLTILFGIAAIWMLARGILVLTESVPSSQVGSNPTLWITVFWYNVLISLLTAAIIWLEIFHVNARRSKVASDTMVDEVRSRNARNKLVLLWTFVFILLLALIGELTVNFGARLQLERQKASQSAQLLNDAFVEHTAQVIGQVDTLLKAVRGYYERTRSFSDLERFVSTLETPRNIIENIYVIGADGRILSPTDEGAKGLSTAGREYYLFHQKHSDDELYIGPTELGLVTGKRQFRLSRRINNPDGSFGGVILIPVKPNAFALYFAQLLKMDGSTAALLGTADRKTRVHVPELLTDKEDIPSDSPMWNELARYPTGSYRNVSLFDGVERQLVYQRVSMLPLVVVTGFSDASVYSSSLQDSWPVVIGASVFMLVVVALSATLTITMLRREEQSKYLASLKESNDRSLALFNATNDAVIMLDASGPFDCNYQTIKLFGASSKEQFLALPPWSSLITLPLQAGGKTAEEYQRQCIEAAIKNGTNRGEIIHKRLDSGEAFQVDIVLTAIQFNGKTVLQAVLRDITERIRIERVLQDANEQLVRINTDKDRFLAMLSHELKTPLAVIRMSMGTDLKTVDESGRKRLIRAVADINAIVERCLQTDRMDHGRIEVDQTVCNPGEILKQVVESCGEPGRVRMDAATLPDMLTDKYLLTVILSNLVDNALKYGDPAAAINIGVEPSARSGMKGVALAVVNQVGVAGAPDPQQLFHRYYRAAGARAKTGSGLGMYIAAGFARMLGGDLSYRYQDHTVKFELWIPN